MIPYWHWPEVWGVPVHLLAVMGGLVVAYVLFVRETARAGLSRARADEFACWVIVGGLVGAHAGYLALNGGARSGMQWLNPAAGAVTMPGLLAGWMGAEWRVWTWRSGGRERLSWWDAGARAFPVAWMVVRLGCIFSHDEAGTFTSCWLGVRYPEGTRHDLAIYEWIWAATLAVWPSERPMARLLLSYGVLRVGVHWLRVEMHTADLVLGVLVLLAGIWWHLGFPFFPWGRVGKRWRGEYSASAMRARQRPVS